MDKNSQNQQLSRAISFARQGLYCAFHDFARGNVTKVTATDDRRDAQEALELLRYLREVARILLPLTNIVPDLEVVCLPWLEDKTTSVRGASARQTLARVLKAVNRIEDRLTQHLDTPPPFAKSPFTTFANLLPDDEKNQEK